MVIYAAEPRERTRTRKRAAPDDPLRTLVGFADGTPVLAERSRKLAPLVEDPLVACCADCGTGKGCGGTGGKPTNTPTGGPPGLPDPFQGPYLPAPPIPDLHPDPCEERLEIPFKGDPDCRGGTLADCGPRPCLHETLPPGVLVPEKVYTTPYEVSGDNMTPCLEELIATAWALLQERIDIVKWTCCMIRGATPTLGDILDALEGGITLQEINDLIATGVAANDCDCIEDVVFGTAPFTMEISADDGCAGCRDGTADGCVKTGEDQLVIHLCESLIEDTMENAGDCDHRNDCADDVANIAAVIVHEIAHKCGFPKHLEPPEGEPTNAFGHEPCDAGDEFFNELLSTLHRGFSASDLPCPACFGCP